MPDPNPSRRTRAGTSLAMWSMLAAWPSLLSAAEPEFPEAPPPAGAGALAPSLSSGTGPLLLSWWEATETGHALRFARWKGTRWSRAQTVVDTGTAFVNWADTPTLAWSGDGSLVAWWPQQSGGNPHAYDVALSRSSDEGRTWRALGLAHDDGTQTEHGFVSMAPDGQGLRLAWLDGRAMPDGGPMQLRSAWLGAELGPSEVIDPRVCDCCGTDLVATEDGPLAVYRDRDEAELRDISAARRTGTGWSAPAVVHPDRWQIPGCPVNGPRATLAGDQLATAWTTGAGGAIQVKLAWSADDGATFGTPAALDRPRQDTTPLGRVDLAAIGEGEVAVVWLQAQGDAGRIMVRRAREDGALGEAVRVGTTTSDRKSGFPQVALVDDQLLVAWTDPRAEHSLRVHRVPLETLPAAVASAAEPTPASAPVDPTITALPTGFAAPDLTGASHTLRGDHDGPVLVHLWASWCPPCLDELPVLAELAAAHPDLRLVSVAVDDDTSQVAAMVEQGQVPGVVLTASSSAVRAALGSDVLPSSSLFGPDDLLLWSHQGAMSGPDPELEALLDDAGMPGPGRETATESPPPP